MNKTSIIYVSGHTGLLGSSIIRELKKQNYKNIITYSHNFVDLLKKEEIAWIFKTYTIDYVFHCAAKVGGIQANINYPADFIYNNIIISSNIINACYEYKVKKLINFGSSCIFPTKSPQPMKENYLLTGMLEPTNEAYAIAKISAIKMCSSYNKQYGTNFISLMPSNLYGSCFSSDTEVFTTEGIKNIKDIKIGDKLYTLNKISNNIEISKVINTNKIFSKESFLFKNKAVDFKVTPEHKMIFKKKGRSEEIYKKEAEFFRKRIGKKYGQVTIPESKELDINFDSIENIYSIEKYIDKNHLIYKEEKTVRDFSHSRSKKYPYEFKIEDFIEFIGWFISEGSVVTTQRSLGGRQSKKNLVTGQIRIAQNKEVNKENYEEIEKLLDRMKIPHGKDNFSFFFSSRLFRNFIKEEIGEGTDNVKIPKFIMKYSFPLKLKKILFNTLMKGDGNKSLVRYSTKSFLLKDQIIELSFILGKKPGVPTKENNCWRVPFRTKRKCITIKYKHISIEKNQIEEPYFCVTVDSNNIIYAGRNKKFNWIGQCDSFNLNNSHVLPALIRKFYEAKIKNEKEILMWGDGSPIREFTYVDDLAKIAIRCMKDINYSDIGEFLNVGSNEYVSIYELSLLIKDIVGYKGDLVWGTPELNGMNCKYMDYTKFNKVIGDYKFTSLINGIKETYSWFFENYDKGNIKL